MNVNFSTTDNIIIKTIVTLLTGTTSCVTQVSCTLNNSLVLKETKLMEVTSTAGASGLLGVKGWLNPLSSINDSEPCRETGAKKN